jgi:hypothetical protein
MMSLRDKTMRSQNNVVTRGTGYVAISLSFTARLNRATAGANGSGKGPGWKEDGKSSRSEEVESVLIKLTESPRICVIIRMNDNDEHFRQRREKRVKKRAPRSHQQYVVPVRTKKRSPARWCKGKDEGSGSAVPR